MNDELDHEEIIKIISSMPDKASPHDVTSLITNIVLAYNLQREWHMIAHMTDKTLKEIMKILWISLLLLRFICTTIQTFNETRTSWVGNLTLKKVI